jgi:XTP/dITP diphosphohydrolase
MNKFLLATTNSGKFGELSLYLSDLPIELVSLRDLNISQKAVESGNTFRENAIIKAKFYCKLSGLPTLADDGGLEIDVLNGQPGVNSHRWVHKDQEARDEEIVKYTIQQMIGVLPEKRGAQLRLVLALVIPDGKIFTSEAKVRGMIAQKPADKFSPGFPFRSLLFLPEINKFYNELTLTPEENERYNHRKKPLMKLLPIIKTYII